MIWAEQAFEESPSLSPGGRLSMLAIGRKTGTLVTKLCTGVAKSHVVRGKANSESEEQIEVSNREQWGLEQLKNPDSVIRRKMCSGFLG